jgi:hypothetical protein
MTTLDKMQATPGTRHRVSFDELAAPGQTLRRYRRLTRRQRY